MADRIRVPAPKSQPDFYLEQQGEQHPRQFFVDRAGLDEVLRQLVRITEPPPREPARLESVHDETGCGHVARLCGFRRTPFYFTRAELAAVRDAADEILEDRRPPEVREPSPDLKEATGRALRSWRSSACVGEDGTGFSLAFSLEGSRAQNEEDLDNLADHLAEAVAPIMPALSTADVEALRWAVDRIAEAALPIGEGELRQRALAAAGRLTARPALTEDEARAIRRCAQWANDAGGPIADEMAEIARAAVDRLRAPGSPESDDRPEATGSKGGEPCARQPAPSERIDDLYVWREHFEARVSAAEAEFNRLHERILELELHRRGVNDGTAEMAARAKEAKG